jgi:hypothetical protein
MLSSAAINVVKENQVGKYCIVNRALVVVRCHNRHTSVSPVVCSWNGRDATAVGGATRQQARLLSIPPPNKPV